MKKYVSICLMIVLLVASLSGCNHEERKNNNSGKKKILLDTDIGCDYDDALALTYLLNHEKVELMGVTTCTGTPWKRAMLAEIICNAHERSVPIYPGEENPINSSIVQAGMVSTALTVIDTYPHKEYEQTNQAVEFMCQVIEDNPHEITLACIGPLTNAALLFSKYPHVAELLDGMIIMGGMFGECDLYWGEIEWNVKCDIDAAAIVFQQDIEDCLVVGVEVTSKYYQNSDTLRKAFSKTKALRPVRNLLPNESQNVWFHDILPLIAYLDDEGIESRRGNIEVLLEDTSAGPVGTTVFTEDVNGRHELITNYSAEYLFEKYGKVVGVDIPASTKE